VSGRATLALAVVLGALGLSGITARSGAAASGPSASAAPSGSSGASRGLVSEGRTLFVASCSACHGMSARGIAGRGPSLIGVGALAADFYLSTGRMPLPTPRTYPERTRPGLSAAQIAALDAYVGSLGGPAIPTVKLANGNLSNGARAFALDCAGCHQISARGGIVTGAAVPALQQASATQIAEAVRLGPYVMPRFSTGELDNRTLDSIARYVLASRQPVDRGGWGIGHIGPIPEGMVAWLFALSSLLLIARVIGKRTA
jgi:ubiquinol-cytochrome c reductase cytochrome c subunit